MQKCNVSARLKLAVIVGLVLFIGVSNACAGPSASPTAVVAPTLIPSPIPTEIPSSPAPRPISTSTSIPTPSPTPRPLHITGRITDGDVRYFLKQEKPVFSGYVSKTAGNPDYTYRQVQVDLVEGMDTSGQGGTVVASVNPDKNGAFDFGERGPGRVTVRVTATIDFIDMVNGKPTERVCRQDGSSSSGVRTGPREENIEFTAIGCKG